MTGVMSTATDQGAPYARSRWIRGSGPYRDAGVPVSKTLVFETPLRGGDEALEFVEPVLGEDDLARRCAVRAMCHHQLWRGRSSPPPVDSLYNPADRRQAGEPAVRAAPMRGNTC